MTRSWKAVLHRVDIQLGCSAAKFSSPLQASAGWNSQQKQVILEKSLIVKGSDSAARSDFIITRLSGPLIFFQAPEIQDYLFSYFLGFNNFLNSWFSSTSFATLTNCCQTQAARAGDVCVFSQSKPPACRIWNFMNHKVAAPLPTTAKSFYPPESVAVERSFIVQQKEKQLKKIYTLAALLKAQFLPVNLFCRGKISVSVLTSILLSWTIEVKHRCVSLFGHSAIGSI